MKRQFAITGLLVCVGFWASGSPAEAACRQMLAPNGWQYITVCDGYRGGSNYSGAIAAGVAGAAIAAEVLPGILENLGDVTNGVGDITSNVVPNMSDPLQNFLSSTNQNSGGLNDGTLNPFNIFRQQPEAAAPANNRKNAKKEEEAPSLFGLFAPQPSVNTPHVNTPAPQVNTPQVNTQPPSTNAPQVNVLIPNIFAPQANVRTPTVNTPQVRTPTPQVYDPMVR